LQLTFFTFPVYFALPMSQDNLVKLRSTESKHVRWDNRNKKRVPEKLELKKYDPTLRKKVVYKEVKK
jgi:large subunit ribosomal protein L33